MGYEILYRASDLEEEELSDSNKSNNQMQQFLKFIT